MHRSLTKGHDMLTLRPYQADAFCNAFKLFDSGCPSCLIVHPTGTGKTVVFGAIAKCEIEDYGGRVLVLAHRDELIQQSIESMIEFGLVPSIEKAGEHAMPRFTRPAPGDGTGTLFGDVDEGEDPRVVAASVQTLQGKRLKSWPPGWFSMVICDEAHHASADSYRAVVDHFKPKKYLGVTATPDRTDGTPIVGPNQIFHALAHEYTITEAVESVPPALTRPFFEVVDCGADISKVRRRQGDLSPEDLAKAIGPHVAKMANEVVHYVRDRAGSILFAPTVSIADAFASAFQSLGIPAISACGKDGDRAEITAGVRAGKWKVACNCALWSEGANFPYIDTVINARPTESRPLFVQMAGRMMRLYPGKTDCLMVGFDWGMTSHKLVHPVELFGGPGLGDLDMAGARKLMDSGKERDVLQAVRRAAKENRERERIKVKAKAETKTARTFRFDPLSVDGGSLAEPVWDKSSDAFARKASDKQIQMLERFKFKADEVVNWTHSRASATISAMIKRREAGLASKPQVDLLNKFRVPNAANLGFGQASDLITKIKGNGWRFVPSMLADVPRHEPRRAERDEFVPY